MNTDKSADLYEGENTKLLLEEETGRILACAFDVAKCTVL